MNYVRLILLNWNWFQKVRKGVNLFFRCDFIGNDKTTYSGYCKNEDYSNTKIISFKLLKKTQK
jgi:hypothetical protein